MTLHLKSETGQFLEVMPQGYQDIAAAKTIEELIIASESVIAAQQQKVRDHHDLFVSLLEWEIQNEESYGPGIKHGYDREHPWDEVKRLSEPAMEAMQKAYDNGVRVLKDYKAEILNEMSGLKLSIDDPCAIFIQKLSEKSVHGNKLNKIWTGLAYTQWYLNSFALAKENGMLRQYGSGLGRHQSHQGEENLPRNGMIGTPRV